MSAIGNGLSSSLGSSYLILICFVRYECEESFTTLNVDIRNHQNLLDSMEQYVKGDLLEGANAYHCEKCNKKVRLEPSVACNRSQPGEWTSHELAWFSLTLAPLVRWTR